MDLSLQKLTKAFNQHYIFKDLSVEIPSGSRIAITGSNGAGKSTLLKIMSGGALPNSGKIAYSIKGISISPENIYRHTHFVAPYITMIEELSLREIFSLHQKLGLLKAYSNFSGWASLLEYNFNPDQPIKVFSSGMKQRIKLGFVLLDDRPLILLDEPTSNLDPQGKAWFKNLVAMQNPDYTLVIASNEKEEIDLCPMRINLGKTN